MITAIVHATPGPSDIGPALCISRIRYGMVESEVKTTTGENNNMQTKSEKKQKKLLLKFILSFILFFTKMCVNTMGSKYFFAFSNTQLLRWYKIWLNLWILVPNAS